MARILVVDDDTGIRAMLRAALSFAGYAVVEAHEGDAALRCQRKTPADLLLTDLVMEGREGIETIQLFKQEFPGVPIIAMSGGGQEGPHTYLYMAKAIGADHVFTKPIDLERLLARVALLVD